MSKFTPLFSLQITELFRLWRFFALLMGNCSFPYHLFFFFLVTRPRVVKMSFCNTLRTEHICVLFYIYILWISKSLSNILVPEAFLLQNDFKSENVKAVAHFLPIDLVTPCIFHEGSLNSGTNQIQVNVNELNPP